MALPGTFVCTIDPACRIQRSAPIAKCTVYSQQFNIHFAAAILLSWGELGVDCGCGLFVVVAVADSSFAILWRSKRSTLTLYQTKLKKEKDPLATRLATFQPRKMKPTRRHFNCLTVYKSIVFSYIYILYTGKPKKRERDGC